jgi:hypothetical protein
VYHREMAAWSTSEETAERTFLKGMLILPASEWQSVPVKEKWKWDIGKDSFENLLK